MILFEGKKDVFGSTSSKEMQADVIVVRHKHKNVRKPLGPQDYTIEVVAILYRQSNIVENRAYFNLQKLFEQNICDNVGVDDPRSFQSLARDILSFLIFHSRFLYCDGKKNMKECLDIELRAGHATQNVITFRKPDYINAFDVSRYFYRFKLVFDRFIENGSRFFYCLECRTRLGV
jgi:hypothetical protein